MSFLSVKASFLRSSWVGHVPNCIDVCVCVVQMRRQFLEVTQIEDFRAVLEALHEQLAEAKRRFDECSR